MSNSRNEITPEWKQEYGEGKPPISLEELELLRAVNHLLFWLDVHSSLPDLVADCTKAKDAFLATRARAVAKKELNKPTTLTHSEYLRAKEIVDRYYGQGPRLPIVDVLPLVYSDSPLGLPEDAATEAQRHAPVAGQTFEEAVATINSEISKVMLPAELVNKEPKQGGM